jgi:hypothetical protein
LASWPAPGSEDIEFGVLIDALRGQQDQLKRLITQKIWISEAPKATLSEIKAQVVELKRLLDQLESDIQDQLKGI